MEHFGAYKEVQSDINQAFTVGEIFSMCFR